MSKYIKYRERLEVPFPPQEAGQRIHDFVRGWGRISKTGKTILWDCWRPAPMRKLNYGALKMRLPYSPEGAEAIRAVIDRPLLRVIESAPLFQRHFGA